MLARDLASMAQTSAMVTKRSGAVVTGASENTRVDRGMEALQ